VITVSQFQFADRLDPLPGYRPADLIPSRGYARCYGCHRPWWAIPDDGYSVPYAASRSASAMCTGCWESSTLDERLAAYRWLADQWRKWEDDFDEVWPAMRSAIYLGSAG
jgi:hypothetical protein